MAVCNVISGGLCVNCEATEHILQSIDVVRIYVVMLYAYWQAWAIVWILALKLL